jgi:hypothetical protein
MKLRRKTVAVLAGTALVLAGGGVAFAYWTNSGSGAGTAGTGTNSAITVNQTSTVVGMGPGVAAQSLAGNFDNLNDGPVFVAAVTATVTGTDKTGCGATDYTIAGTAPVAAQVPVGTGVGAWSGLTIAFNNKAGVNQDACKGAVVAIAYASS